MVKMKVLQKIFSKNFFYLIDSYIIQVTARNRDFSISEQFSGKKRTFLGVGSL